MTRHNLARLTWRKSSHSSGEDDNSSCIEVASSGGCGITTRDSRDPHGPVLHFDTTEWTAFLARIKQDTVR